MDFDRVLEKCGNFNRYQIMLMCIFGVVNIFSSFHYFSQTIISFTPPHTCIDATFPNKSHVLIEDMERDACSMRWLRDNETAMIDGQCTRWLYEREFGYESISTELNWVCDETVNLAIGQSLFYVGSVFGTIMFGYLADKYGRLPAMILSNLSGALGDFATSFTSDLTTFAVCRFISGLATDTCFYLMYIMVFEYIRPSKRTFTLNFITGLFYAIGLVMTPWIAVLVGDWRTYLRVVSAPIWTVILSALILCESAQWLLTQKKYPEAIKCLKRVAKMNKREVDESVFKEFEEYYRQKAEKETKKSADTFVGMFKTPRLRKVTIILFIKSMIITLSYDIVSRNMEGLGSSPFYLFSITSVCCIPAALTIMCLQNRIGRKAMAIGSLLLAAIFTTTTGYIIAFKDMDTSAILLVGMTLLARYGAVMAYEAEAQYGAELIPTSVRAQGVANVHVIGYALSFLTSYIIFLGKFFKPLPSIILSVILVIGAVISLWLPETLNRKLPDTLAEGEQFGVGEKCFDFLRKGRNEDDNQTIKDQN